MSLPWGPHGRLNWTELKIDYHYTCLYGVLEIIHAIDCEIVKYVHTSHSSTFLCIGRCSVTPVFLTF